MHNFLRVPASVALLALGLLLGGCADPLEEKIGECEPGVSELSRADSAMPPGC